MRLKVTRNWDATEYEFFFHPVTETVNFWKIDKDGKAGLSKDYAGANSLAGVIVHVVGTSVPFGTKNIYIMDAEVEDE